MEFKINTTQLKANKIRIPWMRYDVNLSKLYSAFGQTAKNKSDILSNLLKYENNGISKIKSQENWNLKSIPHN